MAIKPRATILTDIIARFLTGVLKNITAKKHRDQHTDLAQSMEHVLEGARLVEGSTLIFDWYKGYVGKLLDPAIDGDITINGTGALPGSWALVKHSDADPPSFLGGAQIIEIHDLAANYGANEDNYLFLRCVSAAPLAFTLEIIDLVGAAGGIPTKIQNGTNIVETTPDQIEMVLDGLEVFKAWKLGNAKQVLMGDTAAGTAYVATTDPAIEASRSLSGFLQNKAVYLIKQANGKLQYKMGAIHVGGDTWIDIDENADRLTLHAEEILLDKLPAGAPTAKALYLDGNGNIAFGDINVSGQGNGSGLRLPPVDTIAERDALSGLVLENRVFVRDDGDGKWADYRVDNPGDGTGANATWVKISDEDLLLNALNASGIRTAYLSNPGTEEFTTADKSKLDSLTGNWLPNFPDVASAPNTGVPADAWTIIGGKPHQWNNTTNTWEDKSQSLTGAQIEQLLNQHLGQEDWKNGGSGGGGTVSPAHANIQENIFNLNNVLESITHTPSIEWDDVAPAANRIDLSSPRDETLQGFTRNTKDLTCDEAGKYLILVNTTATASVGGGKYLQLVKNGTDLLASQAAGDTILMNQPVFWVGDLAADDTIDIRIDGQFAGNSIIYGYSIVAVKVAVSDSGGSGGGGSTEYLPNYPDIASAPTSGVAVDSWTVINDLPHKFDGTTWVPAFVNDDELIYNEATGGFVGSLRDDWVESGGDLTSIKDLKSAQLFVPTSAGDILYNAANDYIESNAVDAKLDINNGVNDFLSPGDGPFTMFSVLLFTASNSDRHIKFQNNAGGNTYKVNPTGLEIRNSGLTTETIPFTFVNGTTYFIAIQRMLNGIHRLFVGTNENDVQLAGESTSPSTTDLGGVNEITMGDTERCHMFLMFHEYLSEASINDIFEQAKADFTLG